MSRILRLTIRTAAGRSAIVGLLADASDRAGVELVGTDVSSLHATAVLAVHDDRPDELVAIDVAAALADAARRVGVRTGGVRLADTEPRTSAAADTDGTRPEH